MRREIITFFYSVEKNFHITICNTGKILQPNNTTVNFISRNEKFPSSVDFYCKYFENFIMIYAVSR